MNEDAIPYPDGARPPPEAVALLRQFIAAGGGYVSGQVLADAHDLSRVSIWNRLKKLQAEGFSFEAIRNRGYRLTGVPGQLHRGFLQATCEQLACPVPVYSYPSLDSTSSEAERLLIRGQEPPFAVLANEQTLGRGRLGRRWESGDGGNIYLSMALKPELPLARMQAITLWLGTAIADFLHAEIDLPIQIKWPNDILIDGRKTAGMLTEARIDSDHLRDLIFGIGINLNADPDALPEALRHKATSIRRETGRVQPIHSFAVRLVITIADAYAAYRNGIEPEELIERWNPYDYLRGQEIVVEQPRNTIRGRAMGITPGGNLQVDTGDGVETIRAGDVTLQKLYPGSGNQ